MNVTAVILIDVLIADGANSWADRSIIEFKLLLLSEWSGANFEIFDFRPVVKYRTCARYSYNHIIGAKL